jgi:tetratricopeptide (TPR) repeat protein
MTTISHMLDCQFYGLNAGGHHLTNVLLHTASVILLFLVLRDMTGATWRSAFVAAVFAVHPLHVESVAWVAERKDVLSGLFFMLTLGAYVRYVRMPGSLMWYLMTVLMFAFGLMSKPMLVTLPLVLLLLDYWPLNRFTPSTPANAGAGTVFRLKSFPTPLRLIAEKIPLLILSVASCILTVLVQSNLVQSFKDFPFPLRIGNALISCVIYVWQVVCPARLAVFYPYPANGLSLEEILPAFMILVCVSLGVIIWRRKHPYLLIGWLWYLGMLVPVIGLVQVGEQARADRYTYLPQIGLYLMAAWMLAELSTGWQYRRLLLSSFAAIFFGALIFIASCQASVWKTSEMLWTYTLANTSNNAFAHNNLGTALAQNGDLDDATVQFQTALAIKPDYLDAYNNLGTAYFDRTQTEEAIACYQAAIKLNPNDAEARNGLGTALVQKGQVDGAIIQFQEALAIRPGYAVAHYNLGNALLQKGRLEEAVTHYQTAIEINSDYAEAYINLGYALVRQGRLDEAIVQFQKALAIQPGFWGAQTGLAYIAWALATSPDSSVRNGTKAVELAEQTDRLSGGKNPGMAATLAAAYAEAGRFPEAITTARRGLQLAASQHNVPLVASLEAQLKLYQAGSPFHDPGSSR